MKTLCEAQISKMAPITYARSALNSCLLHTLLEYYEPRSIVAYYMSVSNKGEEFINSMVLNKARKKLSTSN